jgi:Tat protein secretion system quality control protein TatD with DNase activity
MAIDSDLAFLKPVLRMPGDRVLLETDAPPVLGKEFE